MHRLATADPKLALASVDPHRALAVIREVFVRENEEYPEEEAHARQDKYGNENVQTLSLLYAIIIESFITACSFTCCFLLFVFCFFYFLPIAYCLLPLFYTFTIPENPMNAMAMMPAMIMVMPGP